MPCLTSVYHFFSIHRVPIPRSGWVCCSFQVLSVRLLCRLPSYNSLLAFPELQAPYGRALLIGSFVPPYIFWLLTSPPDLGNQRMPLKSRWLFLQTFQNSSECFFFALLKSVLVSWLHRSLPPPVSFLMKGQFSAHVVIREEGYEIHFLQQRIWIW